MQGTSTSTLYGTEHALKPWVLATLVVSMLLDTGALLYLLPRLSAPTFLVVAALTLAPVLSNCHYLRTHDMTTVGMIPVSLFSLLPVGIGLLAAPDTTGILRAGALALCCPLAPLALLFCWWGARLRLCYQSHPTIDCDAVLIVLGGAIKRGRPCETLARRLDIAARLWHEQPGRLVLVSGGPTPDRKTTEAHEMARYLQELGVPDGSLILEPAARNTHENVSRSLALLAERGISRQCCVVTSDYHLWRARRYARQLGVSLVLVPAPTPPGSVSQQWCREILTILARR